MQATTFHSFNPQPSLLAAQIFPVNEETNFGSVS